MLTDLSQGDLTLFGVLLAALVGGCDATGPIVCTDEFVYGLEVEVENSETGEPVAEALVVATDGAFADSARTRLSTRSEDEEVALAQLAGERPGTCEVTVEKETFLRWTRQDAEVTDGVCHVNTVTLTVRLEPS